MRGAAYPLGYRPYGHLPDELRHLDELLPLGAVAGTRYPEAMMA